MKKEHMEYFYYEARYIKWDEFQECMIKPTDSLEECQRKIGRVTCCFESHVDKAYTVENIKSIQYKMFLYDEFMEEYETRKKWCGTEKGRDFEQHKERGRR